VIFLARPRLRSHNRSSLWLRGNAVRHRFDLAIPEFNTGRDGEVRRHAAIIRRDYRVRIGSAAIEYVSRCQIGDAHERIVCRALVVIPVRTTARAPVEQPSSDLLGLAVNERKRPLLDCWPPGLRSGLLRVLALSGTNTRVSFHSAGLRSLSPQVSSSSIIFWSRRSCFFQTHRPKVLAGTPPRSAFRPRWWSGRTRPY
jgi:hypothetical protein